MRPASFHLCENLLHHRQAAAHYRGSRALAPNMSDRILGCEVQQAHAQYGCHCPCSMDACSALDHDILAAQGFVNPGE